MLSFEPKHDPRKNAPSRLEKIVKTRQTNATNLIRKIFHREIKFSRLSNDSGKLIKAEPEMKHLSTNIRWRF